MSGLVPGRRRASLMAAVRTCLITVALVTAYYLLPLRERGTTATSALLLAGVLAVAVVFSWEAWAILSSPHPRLKAVEALVVTLALFLVLFAGAYYVLDGTSPDSFTEPLTKTDALYFTLSTFTTVGYGDITAASRVARVTVMLQMTCGLFLAGIAVRILTRAVEVGLLRRDAPPPEPDTGSADREERP
ncbi:potassium channel family protein [Streptomyces sp. NPDC086549]|uniref:potassium channel family protein n=1 Tax=Streptomyces sp. NPDC086549 TaxID=3365752 RepID=UPI0037FAE3B8